MIVKVPVREIKIYQADDSSKIEEHKIKFIIEQEVDISTNEEKEIIGKVLEMAEIDIIYIGCFELQQVEEIGTHELKFPIIADSIEEAFQNFAQSLAEFSEENRNQIITPEDRGNIIS